MNRFYQSFVDGLKGSHYVQLEQLVRDNGTTAQESLRILRGKIRDGRDPQRREAYHIVAQELEELLAVTSGERDCEISRRIALRARQTAIPADAREAFRRARAVCPDNLDALLGGADTHKRLGNFDEAIQGYENILQKKKNAPEALMGLSEVWYSAGLYGRCIPYLAKVLNTEPENKKAKALLASATKEEALDHEGIIPSDEIVARLAAPLEGTLMCMCPVHAKLVSRIRFRSVTFSTGSTRLDADAKCQLSELAHALKADSLKRGRYLIEGYADPMGHPDYNKELSLRRATAVKQYLVEDHQVDPDLVSVTGVGASRSWTTNSTVENRRANRRIEVINLGEFPQ